MDTDDDLVGGLRLTFVQHLLPLIWPIFFSISTSLTSFLALTTEKNITFFFTIFDLKIGRIDIRNQHSAIRSWDITYYIAGSLASYTFRHPPKAFICYTSHLFGEIPLRVFSYVYEYKNFENIGQIVVCTRKW